MVQWPGVSWLQIEAEWTDSQLWMFFARLNERIERESEALEKAKAAGGDAWRSKWRRADGGDD